MGIQYLVTGAAGHLGNTIVNQLVREKKAVRALVLECDRDAVQLPDGVQVFTGDVCVRESLRGFFELPLGDEAIVIHAAGIVSITSRRDKRVWEVNVGGTRNVVLLCMEYRVKKLVHVSSVHALPELPKGEASREIGEFDPARVKGTYAKTKAAATAYVLKAAKHGLNVSVVQPSGIFGPYDYGKGHLTQLLIDYCRGSLIAGTGGGYDFVDVRDVASGIIACCEKGRRGECYILSNRYFPVKQVLELFHGITGKKRVKLMIPMWLAKLTAPLSEIYYKIRRQPPLYTAYSLYVLTCSGKFSHEKASRELEFSPRPFEETVRDTYEWMKGQGRI